jgi:hypothetical protein
MRVLVTIAHYCKPSDAAGNPLNLGSMRAPLSRLAAFNAQLVSLHRYFGPRRLSVAPGDPQGRSASNSDVLDILVMTARDANLLNWIGIVPSSYSVEYFDGPPIMLAFEAQRIMRERAGQYDFYVYLEDDLIIDDPAFLEKIGWFARAFGPRALLLPIRYEMSSTGTPAKVSISFQLDEKFAAPFRREGLAPVLTGRWHGAERTFRIPNNPHAACYVLTDEQLRLWIGDPSFYDRDGSWVDPLASAATFSPGKFFGLYMPAEPDPWFLGIEHYGTRYAAKVAPAGVIYGDSLLLTYAETALETKSAEQALAGLENPGRTMNAMAAQNDLLRTELETLKRSTTRLFKAIVAVWRRKLGKRIGRRRP